MSRPWASLGRTLKFTKPQGLPYPFSVLDPGSTSAQAEPWQYQALPPQHPEAGSEACMGQAGGQLGLSEGTGRRGGHRGQDGQAFWSTGPLPPLGAKGTELHPM